MPRLAVIVAAIGVASGSALAQPTLAASGADVSLPLFISHNGAVGCSQLESLKTAYKMADANQLRSGVDLLILGCTLVQANAPVVLLDTSGFLIESWKIAYHTNEGGLATAWVRMGSIRN